MNDEKEKPRCIDCGGAHGVEPRWPGYGTKCFMRCETCGGKRLAREEENRRRYFGPQPADFDPADAGETWEDPDSVGQEEW